MFEQIRDFFKSLYTQLVRMNDSPQRIAIGFALGVFLGVLPVTGAAAAVALAFIFRLNKAAAFLGSMLTNTWLSLVTIVLALNIGGMILGVDGNALQAQAQNLLKHFSWKDFFDASVVNILKPLLLGYLIIGLLCGLAAYVIALILLNKRHKKTV